MIIVLKKKCSRLKGMQGSCISHVFSKTCFCATINEFLKNDSYDVSIKFILVFQNISDELG